MSGEARDPSSEKVRALDVADGRHDRAPKILGETNRRPWSSTSGRFGLRSCGPENLADLAVRTVGRIELFPALDERLQFSTEHTEFTQPFVDIAELDGEEFGHVAARLPALGSHVEHATDLNE